ILGIEAAAALGATVIVVIIMDCIMTFMGSTSNDAAFNAWITDITDNSNRAKTEGLLATMPVLAMVIVTVAFGVLASSFGYPECFIGLGVLVTICGIIGIFTVKDSLSGEKKNTNFWSDLIYGFRPSVIKANRGLYLSLACLCIYCIAVQVFFPYLFIYVQHQIGLDLGSLNITPVFAIAAVLIIGGVIAGAIIMGSLMDKKAERRFRFPRFFSSSPVLWQYSSPRTLRPSRSALSLSSRATALWESFSRRPSETSLPKERSAHSRVCE
ncbi:MAG: MFS transporter, partial [Clostridia bacterium]|nr:MFS transporter [Clostridia bacterium]